VHCSIKSGRGNEVLVTNFRTNAPTYLASTLAEFTAPLFSIKSNQQVQKLMGTINFGYQCQKILPILRTTDVYFANVEFK
jgi:hypothetical protein